MLQDYIQNLLKIKSLNKFFYENPMIKFLLVFVLTDLDAVFNGLYWSLYVKLQVQITGLIFIEKKVMWIKLGSDMHVSYSATNYSSDSF